LTVTGSERLADVRAWSRVARPPKPLGTRLEAVYVLALAAGTIGLLVYGTASSVLADWITESRASVWGPSLMLVGLALVGRWGTWQGPVVFRQADIGFLLGAPLPRAALVAPRLGWAFARGALVGALIGGVALVGLAGNGRSVAVGSAAGLVVGIALYGVLGVALAWAVESSARVSRWLGRALPVVLVVAAGLVVLAHAGGVDRKVALWSGPWGWAVQPAEAVSGWGIAVALVAVAAALAAWWALGRAAACSSERHAIRAEAREGATLSLTALDIRSAQLALRRVETKRGVRLRSRLALPRGAAFAVPWRDMSALFRAPGRVAEGALLAAAGTALAVTQAGHFPATALAALIGYVGVARLLEPFRLEVDTPGSSRILLLRPFGRVLVDHVAVPIAVVVLAGALAIVPCALTGVIAGRPAAVALVALITLPTVALCAAMSARRGGRMPLSVLFFATGSDPAGGGIVMLGWLIAWPAAAAVLAGDAIHLAAKPHSLGGALIIAVAAPLALRYVLRQSRYSA
jgi:hypothetical protein